MILFQMMVLHARKRCNHMANEIEIMEINETTLQSKIYLVRGQKVMLDFELAELYGYTTTRFNEQVKNNIEKFDDDFMFELTKEEFENLMSKKSTSSWGGRRKLPKAFTEQGIYMLMTVLKGELAIRQSKALIRTFKRMKDYIIENQGLIGEREYLQMSMQVTQNVLDTLEIRHELNEVEDQMADVVDKLSTVVYKSDLFEIMTKFGEPQIKRGYLILNGEPFKADLAYNEIYQQAKNTIYIIDNYIGIKTLEHLIDCKPDIDVTIFSDNLHNGLRANVFSDFCKEYPYLHIVLKKTGGIFHDRFIVLDYGTDECRVFLCGASSKDAGARITTINEIFSVQMYDTMIGSLINNSDLQLK